MEISAQVMQRIDDILREQIGLNAKSIGETGVTTALLQRMNKLGLKVSGDYLDKVLSPNELQQLIESVVVPETWFFRDMTPFRCIQQVSQQHWRGKRLGRVLRVLSIPCSTGEEPYSVAVALLASGLLPHQFTVDAIDISQKSLERAAEGHYGESSFREKHAECGSWRDQYFERRGERYHVRSEARQQVTFKQGNLVANDFLLGNRPYDLVLCRNLLIYFDGPARLAAMKNLKRLLHADGVMYSGHAEAAAFADAGFAGFDKQFPFAFQHAGKAAEASPSVTKQEELRARSSTTVAAILRGAETNLETTNFETRWQPTPNLLATKGADVVPVGRSSSLADWLKVARRTADAGQLPAARKVAEQLAEEHPTEPDVWCLLGVIQQASGHGELAERSFEKAIYIDPGHEESLTHLWLSCERRGEVTKAALYRRRIGR